MDSKLDFPVKLNVMDIARKVSDRWRNETIAKTNDHVIRLSVLHRDFHWHVHRRSDETFYVIEGKLLIDLEGRMEELSPGEMLTIPKGVRHRTRANLRTVLLCFEAEDNDVEGDE